jgi:VWFA-related protein
VSLDVEVLDKNDNLIPGLIKEDFVIEEDGKPVNISNFSVSKDRPLSLVMVLDTSTLSTRQLSVCKRFILILAHKLAHSDELGLYSFNAKDAYLEQDLTTDRPTLMKALDNIGVPSKQSGGLLKELFSDDPRTGLAIDLSLRKLNSARNGKKALLLISNRFRGSGKATVDHIEQSGSTLLTLAFPHKSAIAVSLGGDAITTDQLLNESGGRQFSAAVQDIDDIANNVADSLKNYYSIGYLAQISAGDAKPRKIKILVPGRECKIHYRRTYIPQ